MNSSSASSSSRMSRSSLAMGQPPFLKTLHRNQLGNCPQISNVHAVRICRNCSRNWLFGWPILGKLSQAFGGMHSLVIVAKVGGCCGVGPGVGVGDYGERSEVGSRARQNLLPVTRAAQLFVPGIR